MLSRTYLIECTIKRTFRLEIKETSNAELGMGGSEGAGTEVFIWIMFVDEATSSSWCIGVGRCPRGSHPEEHF